MKAFEEMTARDSFPEMWVERALAGIIRRKGEPTKPRLSPSGLGCPRSAAFKLMGSMQADSEETFESNLPADMGTFVHERVQRFLRNSEIWVDVEDYIKKFPELGIKINPIQKHEGETSLLFSGERMGKRVPPFSFQCDGILNIDGEYYILEIKTETETAWQKREAPNPKHEMQGVAYSLLYGVRKILWLYASRESFGTHRKEYLQEVSESKISNLLDYVVNIGDAVERKDVGSLGKIKDCRYCAFKKMCNELDRRV